MSAPAIMVVQIVAASATNGQTMLRVWGATQSSKFADSFAVRGGFTSLAGIAVCVRRLLQRLQFLARLEADGLPWRDRHFGTSARVAANARLARTHIEDSKATQLDPLPLGQCAFHTFENGFDGHFGLGLGDTSAIHNFIDNVEL